MKKKDKKFKQLACQFKNEAECEEELEAEGLSIEEADKDFFED